MSDPQALSIALSLVAALFALLTAILGWMGNKIYTKLNDLGRALTELAGDLHERINGIDRRVTVIETVCKSRRDDK